MKKCTFDCIPCCDYCRYVKKKVCVINPHLIVSEPVSCILHRDKEHRHIVDACGYCDDFYCVNAIDNKSK